MIVIVAAAAVAAVFYPLLTRRGAAASGDLDVPERAAPAEGREPRTVDAPRAADTGPSPAAPAASSAPTAAAPPRTRAARADDELEAEVLRYRDALRAGTVCEYCRQANPPGSRFCYECGQRLETPAPRGATPET
ncbi:MAG TPA: zinc ribbon domain-containing protein [Longimicrobiales bacterium]|nr:zinc ribbon domain-containing protein [Longimicrobiales bacterium]